MSFLRFLMLLSLVAWVGGLIFFAFVLAPTAFSVLPNTHFAGNVVRSALSKMHWIAIVCGILFLISSLSLSRIVDGTPHIFAPRNLLILIMLLLTAISNFGITPRMGKLRAAVGDFASVAVNDPARVQFDALHAWSTRVEGAVLLLGLIVVYLVGSAFSQR